MKKIAILTERLKTGFGVDLVVHEQAKRLAKKYEVTVFAIEIDLTFKNKFNYSTYKLRIPLSFNPIKQDYIAYNSFKKYEHILNQYNVFVIQTPTYNSWINKLKKYGKVIIYHYGNSPSDNYSGFKKYRKNIFDLLENYVYFNKTNNIATISEFLRSKMRLKHKLKTKVIPLGSEHIVEYLKSLSETKQKSILSSYFINKNEKVITYVGRLDYVENPYKNTYDLIKLRKYLDKNGFKNVKMMAIGYPQNRIETVLYSAGICVVPNATNQELAVLMKASYIYFSPSLWEGFNLPFIEAQTLGIPVVGYKVGAHSEVVIDGTTGYLVKNFREITVKISALLNDRELRNKMSHAAKQHAENYSWDSNVSLFENML